MTPGPVPVTETELPPERQLDIALAVVANFQQAAQSADGKANMLIAVEAGAIAATVARLGNGPTIRHGWQGALAWVCLSVFLCALASSAYCVAQAVRPRMVSPADANRFSFPTVAVRRPSGPDSAQLAVVLTEARALAELLAVIAMTKNRYLNRTLVMLGLMLLSGVPLLALTV